MLYLLLALLLTPQQEPARRCFLSGIAVNSVTGEVLANAEITLESATKTGHVAIGRSDVMGNFEFTDIDAGRYRLKGQHVGFLETYYGARTPGSRGITLALQAGEQMKDLDLKIIPFAVIAGTVRGVDGRPLADAEVNALRRYYDADGPDARNVKWVRTDDLGQYRLTELPPGKYFLRADPPKTMQGGQSSAVPPQPEMPVPTFFPDVGDPGSTAPVEVAAGDSLTADIDMQQARVFRISGRVTADMAITGAGVSLVREGSGAELLANTYRSTFEKDTGRFELAGVPSASYLVNVIAWPPGRPGERLTLRGSAPVFVGDTDVEEINVAVAPCASVAGRTSVTAPGNPRMGQVNLNLVRSRGETISRAVAAQGPFAVGDLYPGRYDVYVESERLYAVSIRSGGSDVKADGLWVSGPGRIPLEIVLSPDFGSAGGTVWDSDGKPAPGATVVLAPATRGQRAQDDSTDQHGRFYFQSVVPGDYRLCAGDEMEQGGWSDPEFLKNCQDQGISLTIHPKGQRNVDVRLTR